MAPLCPVPFNIDLGAVRARAVSGVAPREPGPGQSLNTVSCCELL